MIAAILSHLPRNSRLASVALISQLFHDLVEEFLYHTISLDVCCSTDKTLETYSLSEGAGVYLPAKGILSLEQFSRLIDRWSARPELARHVKNRKTHPPEGF
jgi:hypothetical protein